MERLLQLRPITFAQCLVAFAQCQLHAMILHTYDVCTHLICSELFVLLLGKCNIQLWFKPFESIKESGFIFMQRLFRYFFSFVRLSRLVAFFSVRLFSPPSCTIHANNHVCMCHNVSAFIIKSFMLKEQAKCDTQLNRPSLSKYLLVSIPLYKSSFVSQCFPLSHKIEMEE